MFMIQTVILLVDNLGRSIGRIDSWSRRRSPVELRAFVSERYEAVQYRCRDEF